MPTTRSAAHLEAEYEQVSLSVEKPVTSPSQALMGLDSGQQEGHRSANAPPEYENVKVDMKPEGTI
jgi:hypothetical protein